MKRRALLGVLLAGFLLAACGKQGAGAGAKGQADVPSVTIAQEEAQKPEEGAGAPGDGKGEDERQENGAKDSGEESRAGGERQENGEQAVPGTGQIAEQTFRLNLVPYGEVTFTAFWPDGGRDPLEDVTFAILKDGQRVYTFPGVFSDNVRANEMFYGVDAVSFPDLNKDGCDDVITICQYTMESGPDAGKVYPEVRIYQGSADGEFTLLTQEMEKVNRALKEPTIRSVREFLEKGMEEGTGCWQEAYIALLESEQEQEVWQGYDLIYLDDDDMPELVKIGAYEAAGCVVVSYHDGRLSENQLYRRNFSYIPRQGLLCNSDGLMDVYCDLVYRMQEGELVLIGEGRYGAEDNSHVEFDDEGNPVYQYFWNGVEMSESAYVQALREIYDASAAKGYAFPGISAGEMVGIIREW